MTPADRARSAASGDQTHILLPLSWTLLPPGGRRAVEQWWGAGRPSGIGAGVFGAWFDAMQVGTKPVAAQRFLLWCVRVVPRDSGSASIGYCQDVSGVSLGAGVLGWAFSR